MTFDEYRAYLEDNPQGLWFKRKLYGFGWTPARWQGWMVTAGFAFAIGFVVARFLTTVAPGTPVDVLIFQLLVPVAALTGLLIFICYKKGEKPRWQWGLPKKENE